jgi:hypothetical protein
MIESEVVTPVAVLVRAAEHAPDRMAPAALKSCDPLAITDVPAGPGPAAIISIVPVNAGFHANTTFPLESTE